MTHIPKKRNKQTNRNKKASKFFLPYSNLNSHFIGLIDGWLNKSLKVYSVNSDLKYRGLIFKKSPLNFSCQNVLSTVNEWQRFRQEGTPKCVQITMLQVYLSAKLRMLSGI